MKKLSFNEVKINLLKIPNIAQWVETVIKTGLFEFKTSRPNSVPHPLYHPTLTDHLFVNLKGKAGPWTQEGALIANEVGVRVERES